LDYDPEAQAPVWIDFLDKVFAGDVEIIAYVQRLLGYCLTGDVSEQILPIFHGSGSNGKSTLLNVILEMLGTDYAIKGSMDLLMVKRSETHPTERADLFGKRLVCCMESEENRRLAESLVKELTGGDRIRARRMREDFWEFKPTHKIILCTNHRPVIRGTDHAMWRRLALVPFDVKFWDPDKGETGPEELRMDKQMERKLRRELPGIQAWCVEGCLAWRKDGLRMPHKVLEATHGYRQEQDTLGSFLAECCDRLPQAWAAASALYERYQEWCQKNGEKDVCNQTRLALALKERGFTNKKNSKGYMAWLGLKLRDKD
jgi:putative DNA primase/helicase